MNKFLKNQELVFQYDTEILNEIAAVLKLNQYSNIQYIPSRHNYLALVKEHQNIINLITKKRHLLFYYSLFPKFYRFFLNKKLRICFDACFLNKDITQKELLEIFSEKIINKAISNNVITRKDNKLRFTLSFVPFENYIFLRDPHHVYEEIELDPLKSSDSVWLGADSIIFARLNKRFLKNNIYKQVLEIGSGTGIQIISTSKFAKFCKAIDNNKRAVEYTKLNVAINKIQNIKTFYSNIFEKVQGRFDLILVNPWFIDLKKGGLEEVPHIMKSMDQYLENNGLCLMLLNSYIKNGNDTAYDYLKNLIKSIKYDLDLYAIGYNIETFRIKDYKKYGIDYYVSYYVVIKKNGSSSIKRYEASLFRKIRDFTFIKAYQIINKF